jgi:uncharacterized protein with GYD domain
MELAKKIWRQRGHQLLPGQMRGQYDLVAVGIEAEDEGIRQRLRHLSMSAAGNPRRDAAGVFRTT